MLGTNGVPNGHHDHQQHREYPLLTEEEQEFARKEVLLRQPGLLQEMQLVTQKRISLQRKPSTNLSGPGALGTTLPSLFVILPTRATTPPEHIHNRNHFYNNNQRIIRDHLDFRLHFVCHHGEGVLEGSEQGGQDRTLPPSPLLHICDDDAHGYSINDTRSFCEEYKISLLSLLHAAHVSCSPPHIQQQYEDQFVHYNLRHHHLWEAEGGGTNGIAAATAAVASMHLSSSRPSPPLPPAGSIIDRIEIAILYLLRYHFSEQDLQEISLVNAGDDYDADSLTQMQLSDIADSDKERVKATISTDGRILGPLRQKNVYHYAAVSSSSNGATITMDMDDYAIHTTTTATTAPIGVVQWLCPDHIDCPAYTWNSFRNLCQPDPTDTTTANNVDCCIETDRAIEVSFRQREHAQRFYSALRSTKCVVKLRIHLEWEDLSNQDLAEFATAVWEANLSDITLDCCCCPEGGPDASAGPMSATSTTTTATTLTTGRSGSGVASAAATGTRNMSHRQSQHDPSSSISSSRHHEHHHLQHHRHGLSFLPLLGILYSPFLVSFTLENFAGQLPPLRDDNFDVHDVQEYSFDDYQQQLFDTNYQPRTDTQLRLPYTNSLHVLVFSRCSRTAYAREVTSLLLHSPNLTELQIECDNIDSVLPMVADATRQFRQVLFLKLSESSWENVEITFHRLPVKLTSDDMDVDESQGEDRAGMEQQQLESDPKLVSLIEQEQQQQQQQRESQARKRARPSSASPFPAINDVQMRLYNSYKNWQHISELARKTRRPPCPILQMCGAIENLTTYCYLRLWEEHQEAFGRLLDHNPRLQGLELMCETPSIPHLWRFLVARHAASQSSRPPNERSFLKLRINDEDCSLMAVTRNINALVFQAYSSNHQERHRELLRSVGDITPVLCFGSNFQDTNQMELLKEHLEIDGLMFTNVTWVLGRRIPSDAFLKHLRQILTTASQRDQLEWFTIRVYAPLLKVPELIRLWNAIVAEAPLNEAVHGTWIRRSLGLDMPSFAPSVQNGSTLMSVTGAPSSTVMMTQEDIMAVSIKEIQDRASGVNRGSSSYPNSSPTSTSTPAFQRQRFYPSADSSTPTSIGAGGSSEQQISKPSSMFPLDSEHTLVLSSSQYFYSSLSSSSSSAANHPHSAETHSLSLLKIRQSVPGPSR